MVLNLGVSDVSSWLESGREITTEVRFFCRSQCVTSGGAQGLPITLPAILTYSLLQAELVRLLNCKVTVFPFEINQRYFERMQAILFPIILAPATFSLGLFFHQSNEVHRMNSGFQNFHSRIPFLFPLPWTSYIERFCPPNKWYFSRYMWLISQCPFIRHVHRSVGSQRQGLLASLLDAHSPPQCQWQSQQIFVKGLTLTVHHSLWKEFDICSEDVKLINAIQRQRLDILVSLRGFVTGQCSVMKILKIDWTECMETPHPILPLSGKFQKALGDVERASQHPKFVISDASEISWLDNLLFIQQSFSNLLDLASHFYNLILSHWLLHCTL